MENSIYVKLSKMRESIKKSGWNNFNELVKVVDSVAKRQKVILMYCFYDRVATLTLLDMDNIAMAVKFQLPADMTSMRKVRQELYKMAFELDEPTESITAFDFAFMLEQMRSKGVTIEAFLERYKIKSLTEVTPDIYSRCMTALNQMK